MSLNAPSVCVKDTGTAKGRGVFALRAFAEGEEVEAAPVLVFRTSFERLPAEVKRFVFDWARLAGARGTHALALGYGSMYNHSNPANLRYEADAAARLLRFFALREVAAGEELTINYDVASGESEADDEYWFEMNGVTPVAD
ncbi:MAG TPA: SET domain-containing protein-lysine N-methyltransferase [Pyrinomonadaceae bacterium]|nr:SET domain-containing protein-lysine N-methyltransferase [Pyrinomonadaceae bacterium]